MQCSCCDNRIWIEPTHKKNTIQIMSKKGPGIATEIGIEMSNEDALKFAQDIISAVTTQIGQSKCINVTDQPAKTI